MTEQTTLDPEAILEGVDASNIPMVWRNTFCDGNIPNTDAMIVMAWILYLGRTRQGFGDVVDFNLASFSDMLETPASVVKQALSWLTARGYISTRPCGGGVIIVIKRAALAQTLVLPNTGV